MTRHHRRAVVVTTALLASLVSALAVEARVVSAASTHDATLSTTPVGDLQTPAWFDDHWIDLAVDWEGARACDVGALSERYAVCFRDEASLDRAMAAIDRSAVVTTSVCSSSLRLYTGTSYSGTVLSLSQRLTILNLSSYAFDNVTSSYKVGACAVEMYPDAGLLGGAYPGNTNAGAQAATMVSTWDNVVSSVWIT